MAQTAVTVASALRAASRELTAAGVDTPELDARRLLEAATGITPEAMLREPARPLDDGERARLAQLLVRRGRREPVSRIVGRRDFHGRSFRVTPDTLDPRPESETVIEAALALVARVTPLRMLDIGTGTGCLLLTLLAERPDATGIGTDISAAALAVARENGRCLGLDGTAQWVETDLAIGVEGPFDLVVANPPYISSGDIAGLAPEVRLHDPSLALDGGPDGLDTYRRIVADASRLAPVGWVVIELGARQADAVEHLVRQIGGAPEVAIMRYLDLAGHTRCVAWKPRH